MNAVATRIRRALLLRRAIALSPYAFIVTACAQVLLRWHAPNGPTETHRYAWGDNYLSNVELCALNVAVPVTFLLIASSFLWASLVLRFPRWSKMPWLQRIVLTGMAIGSVTYLANIAAHGGRWPITGF